ncbi:MAG: Kelch repeat-containing protein, partial [Chitinophagales bacterium]
VFHQTVLTTFLGDKKPFVSGGNLEPQIGKMINPEGGTWDDIGSNSPILYNFNTATYNLDTKQLFIIGGTDQIPSNSSNLDLLSFNALPGSTQVHVLSESDNNWHNHETSIPRAGHTATLLPDGQIFLIGGNMGEGSTEIYDPNTSTTTLSAPLQFNRYFHTATMLEDNQIVVIGGIEYSTQLTSKKVEVYNPSQNTFEDRISSSDFAPRLGHTVNNGVIENTVVIIGGQQDENVFHDDIWTYYPNQERGFISSSQSLPLPSAYHTTTVLPNDMMLIVGGKDANKSHESILLLDLEEDTILTLDCSLTHARHGHSTTLLNTDELNNITILVLGGQDSNGAVLQSEEIVLNINCIVPLE